MPYQGYWSGFDKGSKATRAASLADLQQASGQFGLLSKINEQAATAAARAREEDFRRGVAALGPGATEQDLARLAAQSGAVGAKDIMTTMQTAANRKAQIGATRETAIARINMQYQQMQQQFAQGDQKIALIRDENQRKKAKDEWDRVKSQAELALKSQAAEYQYGIPSAPIPQIPDAIAAPGAAPGAPVAAPAPAAAPGMRESFSINGQPVTDPTEIASIQAANANPGQTITDMRPNSFMEGPYRPKSLSGLAADTAPPPLAVAPPSDVNSRELARAASMAPASAPVPAAAPVAAPVVAAPPVPAIPPMPPQIAKAPRKIQDQWALEQEKNKAKLEQVAATAEAKAAAKGLKAIPSPIVKAYVENSQAMRKIDDALAEAKLYPDAFGVTRIAGETINQRMDPKGVKARALVADIGSLKIHDRSGAAVTAAETPRLLPFIPQITDKYETIKTKLGLFRKEYEAIQKDVNGLYNEKTGYGNLSGAAAAPPSKPRRRVSDALPEYDDNGWQLQEDAQGNKAYVGPKGEIREVQ